MPNAARASVVCTALCGAEGQETLDLEALCRDMGVPVVIGNCVTYEVALQLMRAGAAGVMVGIGPGAACTSRGVLGVGWLWGQLGGRGGPALLLASRKRVRGAPLVATAGRNSKNWSG